MVETADHGLLIGGESMSGVSSTKTSPNYGSLDYWIIRLDANGNQLWDKSFGGNSTEQLRSLALTADGGIVRGGESGSGVSGNKSSPGFGVVDYWVVRLDASGNKLWERSYGGTLVDEARSVVERADGRLPVALVNGQFYPSNAATLVTTAPVQIQIQTTFTNGTIRYTLDGSDTSGGAAYSAPFTMSKAQFY